MTPIRYKNQLVSIPKKQAKSFIHAVGTISVKTSANSKNNDSKTYEKGGSYGKRQSDIK